MEFLLVRLVSLFQGVNSTFSVLLIVSIALFLVGEFVWWLSTAKSGVPGLNRDDARLKFVWTIAPAFILALLLLVHPPRPAKKHTAKAATPRAVLQPVVVPMPPPPVLAPPRQGGA